MVNTRTCANAVAITCAILYVACALFVAILPGSYMWILNSWSHGMNIASLYDPSKVLNVGSTAIGLVTFTIVGWLTGALFASLYNRFEAVTASR